MERVIALVLLNLILMASPLPQTEVTFKIGAWGDDSSRGNIGAQVEIETHAYNTPQNTLDYFWVGDDLSNGAFVQFGYSLEPGSYCLRGAVRNSALSCLGATDSISAGDARWQWQYWPDRFSPDYYYEIGPQGSAGGNATLHTYAILPTSTGYWSFAFDNRVVANTSVTVTPSIDPVFIVAEGTASNVTRNLGPVRFQDLSYFDGQSWKKTNSLIALSYCGISVACAANQYGAIAEGADTLLAGSDLPKAEDGTLLWTSGYSTLEVDVHPGVQFIVTSPLGTIPYSGQASINLPNGMFAYVSLLDATASTPGVLGWFGGEDTFLGWTGAISSTNLTARVLMDSNKTVIATWQTNLSIPIILAALAVAAAAALALLRKQAGKARTLR